MPGMRTVLVPLLYIAVATVRSRLQLEILALRQQLAVLQYAGPRRLQLQPADRMVWVCLSRLWSGWRHALVIVKADTVVGGRARASDCSGPGRPAGAGSDDPRCRRRSVLSSGGLHHQYVRLAA